MRQRLDELNTELERDIGLRIETRTGVNTGEVVAGDAAQTLVTGDAVNTAARLEQAAGTGEIFVGATTEQLIRSAAVLERSQPISAKGKAELLTAFRLVSVATDVARLVLPRRRWWRVMQKWLFSNEPSTTRFDARRCWVVVVVGPAGAGKSRLVAEFAGSLERNGLGARPSGRCLSYGEGLTYWPWRDR